MGKQRTKHVVGKKRKRQTACGKSRYRDHGEAIAALRILRGSSARVTVPARAYECSRCGGWHLTSQA